MTVKDGESFQNIKSNGDKQYSLGNFGEAIQKYSTYIQRNSSAGSIDLALVYSNRCACYLQQGNVNNALADAEKCVRLNPTWVKGHNRKANCLMRLGREADAAKSYRAAIECDPENLEAIKALKAIEGKRSSPYAEASTASSTHAPRTTTTSSPVQPSSFDFGLYWNWMKNQLSKALIQGMSLWNRLSDTQKGYVYIAGFVVVGYYFFFSGGGGSDYYYSDYGYQRYYGGASTGLSWSALALVMFAAYKVPPMFPDLLGDQLARPFFGMSWMTFMWLVNMLTQNRSMGGGGFMFNNRRRRNYF